MVEASELTWMERNGVSPAKVGVIAVLAVVFVAVAGYQTIAIVFRGESQEQAVALLKPVVTKAVKLAVGLPATSSAPKREAVPNWPVMSIEETLRHDPFLLPEPLRAAIAKSEAAGPRTAGDATSPPEDRALAAREAFASRRAERLSQMQQKGADVVIVGKGASVAVIDGVELRVGDVVDGLRIQNISRLGIDLVEVEPTP